MLRRRCCAFLFPLLLLGLTGGCGGGSGAPATTSPPGTRQVDVFVTDGFNDDYAQVWVTLFKIEAGKSGAFTTVYESADGKTVNMAALKDSSQFLSSVMLPDVAYDTLRITFGDTITLIPTGGGAALDAPVEARENLAVEGGKATLTLHEAARNLLETGNRPLVMDFNLAAFTLVGGKVRPEVKADPPADFEAREPIAELTGTVTELQPGHDFVLQLPSPASTRVHIFLNGDTRVVDASGHDATLDNGQSVFVRGTRNSADRSVTATNIRILTEVSRHQQTYRGTVVEINEPNSSFVVAVREGTAPLARERLIVLTNAQTVFRKLAEAGGSADAAFGDLRVGQDVTVTGELDADRLRLTALRVEIHARVIPPIMESAKGAVLEVGGDRFVIGVSESSPIVLATGLRLGVVTNSATTYRRSGGGAASYADIRVGAVVRVYGALNSARTQITAAAVEILQDAPPVKTTLTGTIAERNESTRTIVVTVTESSTTLPQTRIRVVVTDATILKKLVDSGEVTATFADLFVGRPVRAVGTLDADRLKLTADSVTVYR